MTDRQEPLDEHNLPAPLGLSDAWKLSPADSQRFVEAILADTEPNDALRAAAERYRSDPRRNQLVVLEGSAAEFERLDASELQVVVQVADRIMQRVQGNAPVSVRRILHEEIATLLLRIKRDAGWETWPSCAGKAVSP